MTALAVSKVHTAGVCGMDFEYATIAGLKRIASGEGPFQAHHANLREESGGDCCRQTIQSLGKSACFGLAIVRKRIPDRIIE